MKEQHIARLAEIISFVPDLAERARLAQQIGLVCLDANRDKAFDWAKWN